VGLRGTLIVVGASTASCAGLAGIEDLAFEPEAADASSAPQVAHFCTAHSAAVYCEDFDGPDAGARFELSGPETSATLTDRFFSSPRALAFSLSPDQPGFARLVRSFATERAVRLSFAWWLRDFGAPPTGNASVLATLERRGTTIAIRRTCSAGIAAVCLWNVTVDVPDVGGTVQSSTFPLPERLPSEDGWSRVAIEALFASDGYVSVAFDDAVVVAERVATMRVSALQTDLVSGAVGVTITQGRAGATDVLADDVLIEITEGSRP
jgi:hypothetical protein